MKAIKIWQLAKISEAGNPQTLIVARAERSRNPIYVGKLDYNHLLMSKFYSELTDEIIDFIGKQKIFFTASAPIEGRINLSPKGMDTFRCLSRNHVAYLDLTGSGNETAAHLRENGRLTIMMCSFSEDPLILRLYGQGEVISPLHPLWPDLLAEFPPIPGLRQIMMLSIESLQTSCGYAVPSCTEMLERPKLEKWAAKKGIEGINKYWQQKNRRSIDGLDTGIKPQIIQ